MKKKKIENLLEFKSFNYEEYKSLLKPTLFPVPDIFIDVKIRKWTDIRNLPANEMWGIIAKAKEYGWTNLSYYDNRAIVFASEELATKIADEMKHEILHRISAAELQTVTELPITFEYFCSGGIQGSPADVLTTAELRTKDEMLNFQPPLLKYFCWLLYGKI